MSRDISNTIATPKGDAAVRRSVRYLAWGLAVFSALVFTVALTWRPPYFDPAARGEPPGLPAGAGPAAVGFTGNTTRLAADDVYGTAVAISQAIYPATFRDNKPNAVVLVRPDRPHEAILSVMVVHFPVDAPILYVDEGALPAVTRREIERLDPEGVPQDRNIQAYVVGDIGEAVVDELEAMKLRVRRLRGRDLAGLNVNIDEFRSTLAADHQDEIMLLPSESIDQALVAVSWVAHMGGRLFFVESDAMDERVRGQIAKRPQDAFLYLVGPAPSWSQPFLAGLQQLGHVQVIPGDDAAGLATGFAGFRDVGRNFGWWLRGAGRQFGWGISENGHNFTFVNPERWQEVVPAAVLSHRGKHGPLLFVAADELPSVVGRYLRLVRPVYTGPQEQLFNHGWIIGGPESIGNEVQFRIDGLLEPLRPGRA